MAYFRVSPLHVIFFGFFRRAVFYLISQTFPPTISLSLPVVICRCIFTCPRRSSSPRIEHTLEADSHFLRSSTRHRGHFKNRIKRIIIISLLHHTLLRICLRSHTNRWQTLKDAGERKSPFEGHSQIATKLRVHAHHGSQRDESQVPGCTLIATEVLSPPNKLTI